MSLTKYFSAIAFVTGCLTMASQPLSAEKNIEANFVEFQLNDQKIAGTLTRPRNIKHPPVVLILHGMGGRRFGPPITNDTRSLFVRTAQLFAENGIASLAISTGGKDGSEGNFHNMTLERRTREALAAIDWLINQQEFDNRKISILGHSQGTLIAISTASRLSQEKIAKSIVLWAPQYDALTTYRTSMGLKIYNQGLNAKPGEIVSWRGAGNRQRSFSSDFFRGLSKVNTLAEIASFPGRLLVITGKFDQWSTPAIARKIQAHHQGDNSAAQFYVGHRMGASSGLEDVDKVVFHTLKWLKAASKN